MNSTMKKILCPFGDFILILVASTCTMGALISAFSFHVDSPTMIFIWAAAALVISLCLSFFRVKGLLILLVPALALFIWWFSDIIGGARWVINHITSEFNQWLFVPVLFPDAELEINQLTILFTALGTAISIALGAAICLRRSTLLTVLFTLPFVSITFVLIFFQPEIGYLLGLLAVYLTMLFSSSLYPDSFSRRNMAVFPAFLFSALIMITALILAPPGDHERGAIIRSIDHQIRELASRLDIMRIKTGVGWPAAANDIWAFDTENVGISDAGTRVIHDIEVLEVIVDTPGVFYLRGYSMQYFDGRAWTVNSTAVLPYSLELLTRAHPAIVPEIHNMFNPSDAFVPAHMTIDVTGDASRNIIYTPYFSVPHNILYGNFASTYAFDFFDIDGSLLNIYEALPPDMIRTAADFYAINILINSSDTYLQISDDTAQRLREFAAERGINANASREEIAAQVADFFTSFGRYTLSPFIIPSDEDFVMYFLENSRQGFCIHYATAATMMLRALDVPARFTSGFVVIAAPNFVGEPIKVTDRNAHAWAEVFFDGFGWLPLEVTPPATGFGLGDGRPGGGQSFFEPPESIMDEGPFFPDWFDEFEAGTDPAVYSFTHVTTSQESNFLVLGLPFFVWLLILLLVPAPFVHRLIAVKIRTRRFLSDDTNVAVIFVWRYLQRLSYYRKWEKIPESIEDIALKARYSNHKISGDERMEITSYATGFAAKVYEYRSPLVRFWIKYIMGL